MRVRKDLASVLAVIWNPRRTQTPIRSDRCEQCGASLNSAGISVVEMATNVICGSLLLAVLTLSGFAVYRWIDRGGFIEYPVWHEPLDDWRR